MSTLATLAALLVALVAIAEATTYTTITTTTVDEEAARGRGSQCQQEIPMQKMSHCRMYMMQRSDDEESSLRMVVNPQEMEQQHLRQCCQQLRNIDRECRCDAIKMVMQQQRAGEMEQMMRKAMELPQRCGVDVPSQCDMQPMF